MFWKKKRVKDRTLGGCCTKEQQVEMYQTLYAKAARERDAANAMVRELRKQADDAFILSNDAMKLAAKILEDNRKLIAELARCHSFLGHFGIETDMEWIKEDPPTPPTGGSAVQEK